MLVPYCPNGPSETDEDIMTTITSEERERMEEIETFRNASGNRSFERPSHGVIEPSIVLDDFLFLGNMQHGTNQKLLNNLHIRHILNVCDWQTNKITQENFNVIHISMADDPQTDIKQHFDRTNQLLHEFYEKKERCLVHCAAGVSRSATIVLAYLMKYHHTTLKEAYSFLVEKRPQVRPNEGFILQLLRYEKDLIRSREIEPSESVVKEENPIETLNEFEQKHATDQ